MATVERRVSKHGRSWSTPAGADVVVDRDRRRDRDRDRDPLNSSSGSGSSSYLVSNMSAAKRTASVPGTPSGPSSRTDHPNPRTSWASTSTAATIVSSPPNTTSTGASTPTTPTTPIPRRTTSTRSHSASLLSSHSLTSVATTASSAVSTGSSSSGVSYTETITGAGFPAAAHVVTIAAAAAAATAMGRPVSIVSSSTVSAGGGGGSASTPQLSSLAQVALAQMAHMAGSDTESGTTTTDDDDDEDELARVDNLTPAPTTAPTPTPPAPTPTPTLQRTTILASLLHKLERRKSNESLASAASAPTPTPGTPATPFPGLAVGHASSAASVLVGGGARDGKHAGGGGGGEERGRTTYRAATFFGFGVGGGGGNGAAAGKPTQRARGLSGSSTASGTGTLGALSPTAGHGPGGAKLPSPSPSRASAHVKQPSPSPSRTSTSTAPTTLGGTATAPEPAPVQRRTGSPQNHNKRFSMVRASTGTVGLGVSTLNRMSVAMTMGFGALGGTVAAEKGAGGVGDLEGPGDMGDTKPRPRVSDGERSVEGDAGVDMGRTGSEGSGGSNGQAAGTRSATPAPPAAAYASTSTDSTPPKPNFLERTFAKLTGRKQSKKRGAGSNGSVNMMEEDGVGERNGVVGSKVNATGNGYGGGHGVVGDKGGFLVDDGPIALLPLPSLGSSLLGFVAESESSKEGGGLGLMDGVLAIMDKKEEVPEKVLEKGEEKEANDGKKEGGEEKADKADEVAGAATAPPTSPPREPSPARSIFSLSLPRSRDPSPTGNTNSFWPRLVRAATSPAGSSPSGAVSPPASLATKRDPSPVASQASSVVTAASASGGGGTQPAGPTSPQQQRRASPVRGGIAGSIRNPSPVRANTMTGSPGPVRNPSPSRAGTITAAIAGAIGLRAPVSAVQLRPTVVVGAAASDKEVKEKDKEGKDKMAIPVIATSALVDGAVAPVIAGAGAANATPVPIAAPSVVSPMMHNPFYTGPTSMPMMAMQLTQQQQFVQQQFAQAPFPLSPQFAPSQHGWTTANSFGQVSGQATAPIATPFGMVDVRGPYGYGHMQPTMMPTIDVKGPPTTTSEAVDAKGAFGGAAVEQQLVAIAVAAPQQQRPQAQLYPKPIAPGPVSVAPSAAPEPLPLTLPILTSPTDAPRAPLGPRAFSVMPVAPAEGLEIASPMLAAAVARVEAYQPQPPPRRFANRSVKDRDRTPGSRNSSPAGSVGGRNGSPGRGVPSVENVGSREMNVGGRPTSVRVFVRSGVDEEQPKGSSGQRDKSVTPTSAFPPVLAAPIHPRTPLPPSLPSPSTSSRILLDVSDDEEGWVSEYSASSSDELASSISGSISTSGGSSVDKVAVSASQKARKPKWEKVPYKVPTTTRSLQQPQSKTPVSVDGSKQEAVSTNRSASQAVLPSQVEKSTPVPAQPAGGSKSTLPVVQESVKTSRSSTSATTAVLSQSDTESRKPAEEPSRTPALQRRRAISRSGTDPSIPITPAPLSPKATQIANRSRAQSMPRPVIKGSDPERARARSLGPDGKRLSVRFDLPETSSSESDQDSERESDGESEQEIDEESEEERERQQERKGRLPPSSSATGISQMTPPQTVDTVAVPLLRLDSKDSSRNVPNAVKPVEDEEETFVSTSRILAEYHDDVLVP
ncbi:hypothetical protein HDU93_008379, partial [Gonapodya sp. JEL0774]